jgi:RNA polymerase sigma-70 factor (ECF subfamily)
MKPFPIGGQPIGVSPHDTEDAFRSIYAEHGPVLLRLATALTSGDRGHAEDLVQETMLRAWTHRDKLDIRHHSPKAWLITVARHLAVDAHRARRARPPEAALDESLAFFGRNPIDVRVDEVALRAAVATLPGPQRRVLTEVYYHDRSAAETARILQIPLGTVRSRIFYGLRALRRALPAHDAVA